MRVASLSLDFGLLLLVLVALLHTQGTNANREEHCPSNTCVPTNQCEEVVKSGSCNNSGNVCCSIVKREFRTLCRHWGGECMSRCPATLTHRTTDCSANLKCCVLV